VSVYRVAVPPIANAIDSTIIACPLLYDHEIPVHCPTFVQTLRLVEQEINQGEPGTAGRPIKFDLEQEMIWGKRGASTNHMAEPTAEQIQIISLSRISPEGPRIRRMICNGASAGGFTRGRSAIGVAVIGAHAARGWPIECHCRTFVGASCNALRLESQLHFSIAPRGVAMAMLSQRI
jgi:hypothetical protein